jgi:2-phospho-L-lactate/phosphoenolpyruvate guanylyltransferase
MAGIVVPFRGAGAKLRLAPLPEAPRRELALAMLDDVLAACRAVGRTLLVAPEAVGGAGVEHVRDPGGGQGAAVAAALALVDGPALVVNSDLPCATPSDLEALLAAVPPAGLALVEARDGTTNALALSSPRLFRPVYGPGSAARFRELGSAAAAVIPNLADDVDELDDLDRVRHRLGPCTSAVVEALLAA